MTQKTHRYDHEAFLARMQFAGSVTGNAGSTRFAAFCATRVKRIVFKKGMVASTSSENVIAYKVSGTSTTALGTITVTSGELGTASIGPTAPAGSITTMAIGDEFRVTKGTDASAVIGIGVELQIDPSASLEELG